MQPQNKPIIGSVESKKPSFISGRLSKKKKKVALIFVALLVALLVFVGFKYLQNSNVEAVVNGQKITKQEVSEAQKAKQDYINAIGNSDAASETSDIAVSRESILEELVQKAAIKQEAAQKNIQVTDEELNQALVSYAATLPEYNVEANQDEAIDFAKTYNQNNYGWSYEYTEESIKSSLLENKLRPEVLGQASVLQVSVPFISNGLYDEASVKDITEKLLTPAVESGQDFNELQATLATRLTYYTIVIVPDILNPDTSDDLPEESKKAIIALEKEGDSSPVIYDELSNAHIYRLEELTNGEHATWGDFIKAQDVQYLTGFTLKRVLL